MEENNWNLIKINDKNENINEKSALISKDEKQEDNISNILKIQKKMLENKDFPQCKELELIG
jgi:hypothetical protein